MSLICSKKYFLQVSNGHRNNESIHTFRSCHEAEGGNPVTRTANIINRVNQNILFLGTSRKDRKKWEKLLYNDTKLKNIFLIILGNNRYHDSQIASKLHGYHFYRYAYCIGLLMMNFPVHHVQVQPTVTNSDQKVIWQNSIVGPIEAEKRRKGKYSNQ